MFAQFKDKKLPTTDFKMMVNGEVFHSISELGRGAAVFRVKGEYEMKDIFKRMAGLSELPIVRDLSEGKLYTTYYLWQMGLK